MGVSQSCIFNILGLTSHVGSLCNIRELINRKQVNKSVPVFSIGDEFVTHAFKAHLTVGICKHFGISSSQVNHEVSSQWLHTTAETIASKNIFPVENWDDPLYLFHRSFLHLAFMYLDLRMAIRWEDGPHIIRHWKYWIPHFLGAGMKNYAHEAANLIANIKADFPAHIAYIATHNRTVNMQGKKEKGNLLISLLSIITCKDR